MTVRSSSRRDGTRSAVVFGLAALALLGAGCDGAGGAPEPAAEAPAATAEAAPRATVVIMEPAEGAELASSDVRVRLGAQNITIVPAGDTSPNSGHHHLLLNVPVPAEGEPIPADVQGFVHLGQAQTEYSFEGLAPGEYTLIAVIGDFAHRVVPQATDTVRFRVVAPR